MPADLMSHFPQSTPSEVGVYVHVPYCLQKCHYCDFVKYGVHELPPIEEYFKLVFEELKQLKLNKSQSVKSLYFGGGTPSLARKADLKKVVDKISPFFSAKPEVSLEINPGTLSKSDFLELKDIGFNRFSLGVQTFNQRLLKSCGRLHSPEDSLRDLETLKKLGFNFSMDLLYGLPGQSLEDLNEDLELIKKVEPPHVSPYNLTLAEGHHFDLNRPNDDVQIEMMNLIEEKLSSIGCHKYEVSNFSKPGYESQQNQGYWSDRSYFSFGMGAHSYDRDSGPWGRRYWNTAHFKKYQKCVDSPSRIYQGQEILKHHEAVTDYIHTSLRQKVGLHLDKFENKFNHGFSQKIKNSFFKLQEMKLIEKTKKGWRLTSEGFKKTNTVFLDLCFSSDEID